MAGLSALLRLEATGLGRLDSDTMCPRLTYSKDQHSQGIWTDIHDTNVTL